MKQNCLKLEFNRSIQNRPRVNPVGVHEPDEEIA
jgi:hypothetical protein